MSGYLQLLSISALLGAMSAGFILAQSPRQRSAQLMALLALGAGWWALCESHWNAAADAQGALLWMRLSVPGWAFLGGLLPHLSARYFDASTAPEMARVQSALLKVSVLGYATGVAAVVTVAATPNLVFAEMLRVPWGWSYVPGWAQVAFFAIVVPCASLAIPMAALGFRWSLSVAPPVHRLAVYLGMATPGVLVVTTEVVLPIAGIPAVRLGSTAYAIFGVIVVVSGVRYGLSFFVPNSFSEEILDTLDEGVAMLTPKGLIRRVNRGLTRLTGLPPEVLVGMSVESLIAGSSLEGLRDAEEEMAELCGADGEKIPVSLTGAPLRDQQGNEMGTVLALRDLREIEQLRRQMVTQARLAAVGELAAGFAHEINNPLAFVRSNLGMLESHVKALADPTAIHDAERAEITAEAQELVRDSIGGVDRASEVVQGVRRFTDANQSLREPTDLNELMEDALAMLRLQSRSIEPAISFEPGPLPPVPGAAQDLRQVFLNLLTNATEAGGGDGNEARVRVSTRSQDGFAIAEISDACGGMSEEVLERIFDPFYTTKRLGDGRGLGLSVAWHIAEAHGGHIEVESALGEGTTFRVYLPH